MEESKEKKIPPFSYKFQPVSGPTIIPLSILPEETTATEWPPLQAEGGWIASGSQPLGKPVSSAAKLTEPFFQPPSETSDRPLGMIENLGPHDMP